MGSPLSRWRVQLLNTPHSIQPNPLRDLVPIYLLQSSRNHLRDYTTLLFPFSSLRILSVYLNYTSSRKVVNEEFRVDG